MVERFINWCEFRNLSTKTITSYAYILKKIFDVENNSHFNILKIICNNSKSSGYQHLLKVVYLLYLKFTKQKEKYLQVKMLKIKKPDSIYRDVLTREQIYELTELLATDSKALHYYKILTRFIFETGCRYSDLKNLKEVDGKIFVLGKGNKKRQILYNVETWQKLKFYGNKVNKQKNTSLNLYIKKIFGDKCSAHTLRRSFATYMLLKGANVKMVQKQMGHQDINTTYNYFHISETENNQIYKEFMLK
ncbi:tyrosine-type recombinase/integrase [Mycoplasmopsis bovigenitalium]|uniref:tyrosine-type recombinase/integrase n=1 Tax=Mycoplasmopsis bovigenitalium TaxID=2112 RepID=UPI000BBB3C56|nr:tyrosine-type recombinase/integrase [Mycoplasmopsis bovigenitalium]